MDGGNSYYRDDIRRAARLSGRGIHLVDCETSGGVWGIERGYCLMIGGEAGVVERLRPIFATIAPGMTPRPGPPGAPGNPIRPGLEVPLEQALDVGTAMPANSLIPARPLLAGWRSSPQPPDRASTPGAAVDKDGRPEPARAGGDEGGQLAGAADRGPDSPRIEDRRPVTPGQVGEHAEAGQATGALGQEGGLRTAGPRLQSSDVRQSPVASDARSSSLILPRESPGVAWRCRRPPPQLVPGREPGRPRPGSAAAAHARSRNTLTGRLESFRRGPGFPTGPRAGRGPARGSRARRDEPRSAGSGAARPRR